MKKISYFIGVDISKSTLDVAIIDQNQPNAVLHSVFSNTKTGINSLLSWVRKNTCKDKEEVVFCMEHTGVYGLPLCSTLSEKNLLYSLVSALEIQRSIGIQRGKSDKADSKAIAKYIYLRRDNIKVTRMPDKELLKLRYILSQRDRVIKAKVMFENSKEVERFCDTAASKVLEKENKAIILFLKKRITHFDTLIEKIIIENPVMENQYKLITSIPGIGLQISANIIAYTQAFTLFDCPRKFACYSGVAPFPYQSGTSIKGRSRVSHLANKKMKSILSLGALLAIRNDTEMRLYYQRKVNEGKNKMLVLSAVRNKLLQRIFAVVKRETPYVKLALHIA